MGSFCQTIYHSVARRPAGNWIRKEKRGREGERGRRMKEEGKKERKRERREGGREGGGGGTGRKKGLGYLICETTEWHTKGVVGHQVKSYPLQA